MKASQHLSSHGISMNQARSFLINNITDTSTILSVCQEYGVTNEMLAEIYGGISRGTVVSYFAKNGLNSLLLDDAETEDDSLTDDDLLTDNDDSDTSIDSAELTVNTVTTADISSLGESDLYAVTLEAGVTYTITMTSDDLDSSYLVLRNASNQRVASDYQASAETEATVTYTPTESGTYYVDLSDLRDTSTGQYTILVASEEISNDDYSGSLSTNGVVAVDGSTTGEIEELGDSDWFAVEMTANSTYTLTLSTSDLEVPYLVVRDSDGNEVEDAFSITDGTVTIEFTADTDGTYYLDVSDLASDSLGTYSVSVDSVYIAPTDDYSSDITTTGTVAVDGIAEGSLETAGDSDWFAVTLVAGSTYDISMSSSDFDDELITLYDASGVALDSSLTTLTYYSDTTATYYISASQDTNTDTGTYLIGVQEAAA